MGYDDINRLISKTYSDGTKPITMCYDGKTYDLAAASCTASLTYANSRGQMTASRNEYVNESMEYDAAGRTKII